MPSSPVTIMGAGHYHGVRYLHVEPEVAVHSAIKRFLKTGRYVSPRVIMDMAINRTSPAYRGWRLPRS
jgi:hypothetical protein